MTDSYSRGGLSGAGALSFGPYDLVRPLRDSRHAERFLALHPARLTHHVAYRFELPGTRSGQQQFLDAVDRAAGLSSPHLLPVEQFSIASPTEAWVISPFVGDHDGLLLLSDLLADKGGMLEPGEVRRAVGQLLEASRAGAEGGMLHGTLTMDEIQVDRRGSVQVELYGLASALGGAPLGTDAEREGVRSIVEIGYELLTGVRPDRVGLEPQRLVPETPADLNAFLTHAIDPEGGFATAGEALAALSEAGQTVQDLEIKVRPARKGFGLVRRRSQA